MKQRVVVTINGTVLYDTGLHEDVEYEVIENNDIADELRIYHKPGVIVSTSLALNVIDRHAVRKVTPVTEDEWDEYQQLRERTV